MRQLKLLTRFMDNIERRVISLLFIEVVVVGTMQVIWRFLLKASLSWSEELLRYSFVWITFLAASVAVPVDGHVNVGLLIKKLKGNKKKSIIILNYIICFIFSVCILFLAIKILNVLFVTGQKSAAMQIPMYILYLAIALSFFSMTFKYVVKIYDSIYENVN